MTKSYYEDSCLYKKDKYGGVKTYFVGLTGEDVVVEKSGMTIAGGEIAVMAVCGISLIWP